MKTAISLPDPMFENVDRLARQLGVSRSELFRRAMERYLRSYEADETTAALDRVYGDPEVDGRMDPSLEHLQAASIPEESW